ncbi:site-specific DNA-methyltransferase [Marvinbryantia formatexigens]|nr:site-specific DNA-methyltransferase [Marvinbryantia formatexigens]UWO25325.1 site-specific DNA-methyltransferase [Marvinbryantia formatexigens DSM 14469]SDG99410.1 DNA modification methylase [Marvinbryantia formatexigens]
MRLEKRKLSELKPAAYNPRKALKPGDAEYEKLAASIERHGYIDPIVINEDGTIIGGHQRRTVMMDLGYEEAEVIIVSLPDKNDEIAANIALNQISGEFEKDALMGLLIQLESAGYDTLAAGFDTNDLAELFAEVDFTQEANDDHYDVDKALEEAEETEPITKYGDIWQLGEHRLMCGDATDFSDIGILMAGSEADLILTDPPYNVDYEAKDKSLERSYKRNTTRTTNEILNDKMAEDDFYNFLYRIFSNYCDVAKAGAAVYVFHADSEGLAFRQAFAAAGFKLAEVLIWEKNQFVIGRQDYHWRHEPILYGWKEGTAHYFIDDRSQDNIFIEDDIDFKAMKKDDLVAYIERIREAFMARTSVQFEKKPARSDMHPTMKPVALVGRLMANSSRRGEIVADFFGGSGTTLIAAEQLGRVAYLMEISPKYCDVIIKRWEEYTGRKAIRVRGGDAYGG